MLTEFGLQNFKNHVDTELKALRPLSVLVGPNGVGKSSVLEAIYYLHLLGVLAPDGLFKTGTQREPERIVHSGQTSFGLRGIGLAGKRPWSVDLEVKADEGTWQHSVNIGWDDEAPCDAAYNEKGLSNVPEWVKQGLRTALHFRLEPSALRTPSYPEVLPPRLGPDGYGLASAVSFLMRVDPSSHRTLTERLREVIPPVVDLRTQPVQISRRKRRTLKVEEREVPFETEDLVVGDELLFDTVDGRGIPAAAQSDGTLLVLGVLTAVSMPEHPQVVLLDDIETGVHPAAQRQLVRLLRKLTGQDPALQIIATTHSPYILDELSPEETWVLGRVDSGPVHAKRLADHPKAEEALRVLTTGEFWSVEGETWAAESGE